MYNVYYYPASEKPFKHVVLYSDSFPEQKAEPVPSEFKLSQSLSRTRRLFFDYAMCNPIFELFVTATFDPKKYDVHDYDTVQKTLCKWLNNFKNRYDKNFRYMFIPEQHDSGAWHFHGLCTPMYGLQTPFYIPKKKNGVVQMVPNTKQYMSWPMFSDKFGHFSCSEIRNYEKAVIYITKYISKSFNTKDLRGRKVLLKSNGLRKPELVHSTYEKVFLPDAEKFDFCAIEWRDESGVPYKGPVFDVKDIELEDVVFQTDLFSRCAP